MTNQVPISVAIATYNEELNIARCLDAVAPWVNEIVVVDGKSTDNTPNILKKYPRLKIISVDNNPNFHINKQLAIDACKNDWVLLLDADEVVSPDLSIEILKILSLDNVNIGEYQKQILTNNLFLRHQRLLEKRDGYIGKNSSDYTAFFVPRLNYFLGKFIRYGGVYPDGVIRLFRKSKSSQPAKSLHEQISTEGKIGWLSKDLYHYSDPTFSRYLLRNNRYTTEISEHLQSQHLKFSIPGFLNYFIIKPIYWFLLTYFRHKGFKDGFPGFVFSWYSSLRFPIAYIKLFELNHEKI